MATARAESRLLAALIDRGQRPVSAASLAVFRMLFGAVAFIGAVRFLLKGWVERLYLAPEHHLTYAGFDWVQPLPGLAMHFHMVLLAALGLCIAAGYRYRPAMAMYAVAFTYVELLDATLYLNHYWFVSIASFVFIFLPLNAMWSVDARAGRVATVGWVPSWVLWTVRGQLAVVYVFAGLAKLQADWLVHAQPMRIWLADRTDLPIIGFLLDEPFLAYVFSWSGALFDCTIVGFLLWRRSRPYAYVAVVVFHAATGFLFQIGIFPWLMIAGTTVFFASTWPLRVLERFPAAAFSADLRRWCIRCRQVAPNAPTSADGGGRARLTLGLLVALAVVEIAIPLRHLAYPGDVRWTEEGYYGSWRVMLTEKGGSLSFRVTDPQTGDEWRVDPAVVLEDWQARQVAVRPDLMVTTAHLLAKEFARQGRDGVEVRADSFVSINGRPNQPMIDPTVDLTKASRAPGHKTFVLPMQDAS